MARLFHDWPHLAASTVSSMGFQTTAMFGRSRAIRMRCLPDSLTLQRLKRQINPGQRATLARARIQENRAPPKCAAPGDDLSIEGAC
jgi:hypothetical protein